VKDENSLSEVLLRVETDQKFYAKLEQACIVKQSLFTLENETRSWNKLLENI